MKLGVFFGSYGDVDAKNEIYELVSSTLQDPDMIPLPRALTFIIANAGYVQKRKELEHEYAAIGGATRYRANSQQQADMVAQKLRAMGYDAKGYTGFAFTFPKVSEGLSKAQRDGVNRLIVHYQGAQHSRVTSHIIFRMVKEYLKKHPEWKVKVTAVTSFYDDPRFIDLLADSIQRRLDTTFRGASPEDVCIFLPMHGNIMRWINQGDPSYRQMMVDVEAMKSRFSQHPVYYGFQNHDELPMLKWTEPEHMEVLQNEVAKDPCTKVIINGRISYTIDSLETLYDHGVAEKELLIEEGLKNGIKKQVVVEKMFNTEESFAEFLKEKTVEALDGAGNLLEISEVDTIYAPTFKHPHE
jgi:ferrochelatase